MKIYQVIIVYNEPQEGVITLYANSEEEAINYVRNTLSGTHGAIEIKGVEELHDLPNISEEDIDPNRKVN